jgi:hypothetical protein
VSIIPVVPNVNTSSRQLTTKEYCAKAVPWYCAPGWIPIIGAPIAFSERCREAYDLERACNAGGFNRHIPAGSGAGKAPDLAAKPGVNYNDPAVLRDIYEEQLRNDQAGWTRRIEEIGKTMSGAPRADDDDDPKDKPLNWIFIAALVIFVVGVILAKK